MKGWKLVVSMLIVALLLWLPLSSSIVYQQEAEDGYTVLLPPEKVERKFRLGYCQTDPFSNFAATFYSFTKGLADLGWIEPINDLPYTPGQEEADEMWRWLAERDMGPYIQFVADAYYSLDEVGSEQALVERLHKEKDLDLLIVMGTHAGQVVTQVDQQIPTMVFSTSNAVQAGIVQSPEDSGHDHIWAHIDAKRYIRQLEIFHDMFQFQHLGIVYENTEIGRIYAAVDDVQQVASEYGFQVWEEHVQEPAGEEDRERYYTELYAANQRLAERVDALYLTAGKWDPFKLPQLLQPFYDKGIPVFSQLGALEVRHGALLSVYRANFHGVGRFGAENAVQVLKGAMPRELSQIYGDTPSIVLNLEVAERIGYQTPFDILLVADEIYMQTEKK